MFFIRLGRHFDCAKRQIEKSSRIFATVSQKLSQINGMVAKVCEKPRHVSALITLVTLTTVVNF